MLILQIAIPTPLRRQFDYLVPRGFDSANLQPGMRVKVPFGRRQTVGIILAIVDYSDVPANKLKPVQAILDTSPVLPTDILELLLWASRYYQHAIGEVMTHGLPALLRQGEPASGKGQTGWRITSVGQDSDPSELKRAARQAALLIQLQQAGSDGLDTASLNLSHSHWRPSMNKLLEKGWVEKFERSPLVQRNTQTLQSPLSLNEAQQNAVDQLRANLGHFQSILLNGVTGSGKTEVYLQLIQTVLDRQQQVMVLVPEIGLTPQLVQRFTQRLACPIAVLHSGLNDTERLNAWLAASRGEAGVVIGTRSALFTPLKNPGLFILDEEHDLSFKQQDGFRYNARDLAIVRAQKSQVPIVLGTATPSLESLHNVERKRSLMLSLPQRAGEANPPTFRLLDIRSQKLEHGLGQQLLTGVQTCLERGQQALLFLNRRGFAPVIMCHDCSWHARCLRCDAHMTAHQGINRLRCHHCGSERPIPKTCPDCESENLSLVGAGTERVEEVLQQRFPDYKVLRIDRDSTRRKGSMQAMLDEIHQGKPMILLGTQMLAKGHHFPNVTLVGLLDADYGLFSADFRATERMGQLILQVAGRSGRAELPGEVLIQTHQPENPLLHLLMRHDYPSFSKALMEERKESELPPFTHLALLRAEAPAPQIALQFLQEAKALFDQTPMNDLFLFGPVPAPMERRAGRYRAQLLIQHSHRHALQQWLSVQIAKVETMKSARKVRWSIDVDPMEMY
ncbi:MAG: primosomal protein N' [Gammaproteobacteria bacterium]|nr:primosomal protein N' [Gammaproteobacteria bacterium]